MGEGDDAFQDDDEDEDDGVRAYEARTNDILVRVKAFFLEDESEPDENRYVWAYRCGGGEPWTLHGAIASPQLVDHRCHRPYRARAWRGRGRRTTRASPWAGVRIRPPARHCRHPRAS